MSNNLRFEDRKLLLGAFLGQLARVSLTDVANWTSDPPELKVKPLEEWTPIEKLVAEVCEDELGSSVQVKPPLSRLALCLDFLGASSRPEPSNLEELAELEQRLEAELGIASEQWLAVMAEDAKWLAVAEPVVKS